jgi:hypothetical protein
MDVVKISPYMMYVHVEGEEKAQSLCFRSLPRGELPRAQSPKIRLPLLCWLKKRIPSGHSPALWPSILREASRVENEDFFAIRKKIFSLKFD